MDFSGVTIDTSNQVTEAVNYILALDISPADKQMRIAKVIKSVGSHFHNQLYGANSQIFDSATIASAGLDDANAQAQRLANKIVRNHALSRNTTAQLIRTYYDSVLGRAQDEAFRNAVSMQRHPTLTRSIVGETCKWCNDLAGTYTYPTGEVFLRHRDCNCLFKVSGYNTRNGLLKNYMKKKKG